MQDRERRGLKEQNSYKRCILKVLVDSVRGGVREMRKMQQPTNKPGIRDPEPGRRQKSDVALPKATHTPCSIGNLFETILEAVNLPITLINSRYEYVWANTCYCVAQRRRLSDLIGNTVADVWGQDVFESTIKDNLDICLGGEQLKREAWIAFAEWGRRYCETVYSPYRPHGGVGAFAIVITYDITERKRAEDQTEESERRFRSLSEASLEAIVFIEDGIIVDANDALSRLFGYEGEDLRGRSATDFIAPEVRPFSEDRLRRRTEGAYESMGVRKDGTTFPIEVSARELLIKGRQTRISAARDLTDRKKIEKQLEEYQEHLERLVEVRTLELRKNEERFRSIFQNAVEGIYQSTPDGRFLSANPALAQFFGCESPKELMESVTNIGDELYSDPLRRKELTELIERDGIVRNFDVEVRARDGAIKYASINARAVKDESGTTLYYEGILQDVTERRKAFKKMLLQRDLALKLAQTDHLDEGLQMIIQAAVSASGLECAGICMKNDKTGGFDLLCSTGLTREFQEKVRHVSAGSFAWARLMEKKSFHIQPTFESTPIAFKEGFRFISVTPIVQRDEVVGCLVTASKVIAHLPQQVCIGLELLAAGLGNIIARMQAKQQLGEEIAVRIRAEKALRAEQRNLEEANTALKVLLKHREDDKKELEEKLVRNVKQLVQPYVKKLKAGNLDPLQRMTVNLIDMNLDEIVSPFLNNIRNFHFTPRQIEIIGFIREGRTTKEIAQLLSVGKDAVDLQRFLIRKKLGINKNKANLRSYLLSMS